MMRDHLREAELSRQHEAEGEDEEELDWRGNTLRPSEDYLLIGDDIVLCETDELIDYVRDHYASVTDY